MNELIGERENYCNGYAQIWNEREVFLNRSNDCRLKHVSPSAVYQHNTDKQWGHRSIWNLLDYPASVFPVTTVDLIKILC